MYENKIEVEFFGEKRKIDKYGEDIRKELLKVIKKYPIKKVGIYL